MELLKKFEENGYYTAELYHLLSTKKMAGISLEIIPSEYRKELSLSYTERINNLKDLQIPNKISNSKGEDVLLFTPRLLLFQNFKRNEAITGKFSVLNNSKSPAFLNMIYEESSYFSIKPYGGKFLSRLAPGMSVTFLVTFTPQRYEDYIHKVTFHTEKDEYLLLFIGMGPRPVFDFPDEIVIPNTPLKVEQTTSILVRNIGITAASFTLITRCPFYVNPKSVSVKPNEKVEIKISLKTFKFGEINGFLNAVLETGENFCINLKGMTYTVRIELEKETVRFLDTYNKMVRQVTFKITNKSPNALNYFCMNNENVRTDFENKIKLATVYYKMKESESKKCRDLEEFDVLKSDGHERVYTRILYDEIQALAADETFFFTDTHFSVTPLKGQLWPNQATDITITFSPKRIGDFESIAYFDVDGLPDRIPLKLVGTSLPPAIQLNVETLDMGHVFINKTYNYEIVAFNKGHIGGLVVYKDIPTLFGSKITCNPHKNCVAPREEKLFCVGFCNSNQGPFFEEVNFLINETDVVLKLYLKGELIYPSLSFSVPKLDFGNVSLGVPNTLEFDVINESDVEVKTTVKISTDGPEISSYTLQDFSVTEKPKPAIPEWPREFEIEPYKFNIESKSSQRLKVTLCANLIRSYTTAIELEFDKSDSPPIVLPVVFNAMVPNLTPAPDINLRACFVDHPYEYDLIIVPNEFDGYFTAEEPDENSPLKCFIKVKEGIIKANERIVLPVIIHCSDYGVHELDVMLHLFGLSTPVVICHVRVIGVRPIITCSPMALHWGQVKLLTRSEKTLIITNDSPLCVNFKVFLPIKDNKWKIEPNSGVLAPESETVLNVILYLNDAASYQNKIHLDFEKVKEIYIPISATGFGTSILIGGSQETLTIGRYFTTIPFIYKVTMENKGSRLHSLEWCEHIKPPKTKSASMSFYKLEPKILKMAAEEKVELIISGVANKATTVIERWFLFGNIEGINKKELLLDIDIIGEFVDPKVEINPIMVGLQYEYGPYNETYKLTDIVTIKNVSGLPLDMDISLKPPFYLIQKESYKIPAEEEHACCCIRYNESDLSLTNISTKLDRQKSVLFIDYLTLKPVEPLRKSPLNFFHDINMLKAVFNLCSYVEINLADQEVMKIQVLLDTTKHISLRSKTYIDIIKVKFKEHKNKDAVKLIGKINFPNLSIIPPRLDFNCVLNGNTISKIVKVQNTTPLVVCFKFVWKKCCINKIEMPIFEELKSKNKNQVLEKTTSSNDDCKLQPILDRTTMLEDSKAAIDKVVNKAIPMINAHEQEDFAWKYKFVGKHEYSRYLINDIIQLVPHRGVLKPHELQHIHVIFKPPQDINVKAILECNVLGGPTETCLITGQSADLGYALNTHELRFGIRVFYDNAIEELQITNTSLVPFHITTYLNDQPPFNELEASIISIEPNDKMLQSLETVHIKVLVKPGIIGLFRRMFLLEIGHLPCMPIDVMGWGVIPQIHLSLNRPNIVKLPSSFGYEAIACLTDEYLQVINQILNRKKNRSSNIGFEACFADRSLREWHICSAEDQYPEIMDIDLAIERQLAINYIVKRPEIMDKFLTRTNQVISGFMTIPFLVDFGVIITGTTAKCVADITNYGPAVTKFNLSKGSVIPTWLGLKLWGKLKAGEVGKIEITFAPTSEDFPELEEYVDITINFEVPYGMTIPIQIKAICSVPFLVSNITNIDFGLVKCGNKMEVYIPIKNVGKTTCVWWVTLRLRTPGPIPITVHDTSGKYEYNEGGMLRITFIPAVEMIYEGLLIFRFHMNPNRMTIPIRGQGLCPRLQVIGTQINFPPTLPYSETKDIFFGITNPCIFPTELIMSHCDTRWKEEEEIYNMLQKYYDKLDMMLVPVMKQGFYYPKEIVEFCDKLKDRVRVIMDQENRGVYGTTGKKSTTSSKKGTASKSPKHLQSTRTLNIQPIRTEAEILRDEILKLKEAQVDPLKECLEAVNVGDVEKNQNGMKGIIIFVHASPCEENNFQEIAYCIGKKLSIPVVNIDLCIARALCVCVGPAKDIIMTLIDEMYESISKTASKVVIQSPEHTEEYDPEDEEDYEIVFRKLEAINNSKNIPTSKGKQAQNKTKNRSPTSSSLGSQTAYGSSSFLNTDHILDLLTEYFSDDAFSRGFVVDTLTSQVLKSAPFVLTLILKCKRTIPNIHLVLCHSEFHRWAQHYEEVQKECEHDPDSPKEYTAAEIDDIVKNLEEMDEEEFENVPNDVKAIYIRHGLEARRKRHLDQTNICYQSNSVDANINSLTERSVKSATPIHLSDSKKKLTKKEEPTVTSKRSILKTGKQMSDYLLMNVKYNDYLKNTYEHLINIANNWLVEECDIGSPLFSFNGQVVGAAQKKAKKKLDQQESCMIYDEERGFPLTILTYSCTQYKHALANMLANSPVIREALRDDKEINILENPIEHKEYTVLLPKSLPKILTVQGLELKFLDEPVINKCECNQYANFNFDDINQDNVIEILSNWHCVCGKKVASPLLSTNEVTSTSRMTDDSDKSDYPLPVQKVKSFYEHDTRIVLQAGDLVRFKFSFNPTAEGTYSLERFVEVSGWPESRITIKASGICDIPRLDARPKKMFENFVRRRVVGERYKNTFIDDLKIFEFGPIFIGNHRTYEEESYIHIRNSSLMTSKIDIQFLHESNIFEFDHEHMSLDPEDRGKLKITAAPTVVGVFKNELLFSVKDNPEMIKIEMSCEGVVPIIVILPLMKHIDYGKMLLYRREDDRIIVKNDSILPIMWKIRNPEMFKDNFIISRTTGVISANDNEVIPITYIACEVGVISRRELIIDIFDSKGRGEAMITDIMYFSAECYDVLVECIYNGHNEKYLNYGNVKVNSTVSQDLYLYNRGKYNIYYKLRKVKNFPYPNLLNSMEVSQENGILTPGRMISIDFQCSPAASIDLHNIPAFTCYLLDGNIEQVIVAKFPINITIASFYNTFTLFPLGELNFHIIPVGVGAVRELIINNTSKCPFTYEIVVPEKYRQESMGLFEKSRGKDNKIRIPPIKCGNFVVYNEDNLLEPGGSRTIQVQFLANEARLFEETINFIVSDTSPAEADGVPLKLAGTGAMPVLDIWNLETTFREHLIVNSLSDYNVCESSPHCVLAEDTVALHFFCVTINTTYTATIDLYNNGLVPCVLNMVMHYQANTTKEIFYLKKYEATIEPLLHKNLDIVFAPKALKEYRAVLEIKLKLLDNEEESYKICLVGEGVIPRIEFILPNIKPPKFGVIRLPVTCLGSSSQKSMAFKNITNTKCVVHLKVIQQTDEKLMFSLHSAEDSSHMLKASDNKNVKVVTSPNEVCTMNIYFDPYRRGKVQCHVKITIENNPFEFFTVLCEAEAFMEDIILLGLDMLPLDSEESTAFSASASSKGDAKKKVKSAEAKHSKRKSAISIKQSSGDVEVLEPAVLKYLLDFGGNEICSLQRRTVVMANNSDKVYKFTWDENLECIVVKPNIGYISPGEEKDLEVIFYSDQQTKLSREQLECSLMAINDDMYEMNNKGRTWANNQTITVFNQDRIINERSENMVHDEITTPSTVSTNLMYILISVTTEFIKYSCNLQPIVKLPDTFIYQKQTFNFDFENVGIVPIKIVWTFQFDEEFPMTISKVKKHQDSIEESSKTECSTTETHETDPSHSTLFSGDSERQSVDTWFEFHMPFSITPEKKCLQPRESQVFTVTFAPLDAFFYKVRLRSIIDNLSPNDRVATTRITAKSLIPYCHLEVEESDYVSSGRRKPTDIPLPDNLTILEFSVVGSGCYQKTFKVVNPTSESYVFVLEMVLSAKPELIPIHCDPLKGFLEGGRSTDITCTFAPTAPGITESIWHLLIPKHSLSIDIMIVGVVREPNVVYIPTILNMKHSLVGHEIVEEVRIKNYENETLKFEFRGNSLCNELGGAPVVVVPNEGVLLPRSEKRIKIIYTPMQDGPLSFKIFCWIQYMIKHLTLCVNALSHLIKPQVLYYLVGNEHVLQANADTYIHLEKTASTYERTVPFTVKNDGSASFRYDWHYNSSSVRKYMLVGVEPKSGYVAPGEEVSCVLYLTLKQVLVKDYPITLTISNGPKYVIYINSDIEKPQYHFSFMDYNFEKCFINAPDATYKKYLAFVNDDKVPLIVNLDFENIPELYVHFHNEIPVEPNDWSKIKIYFRPKEAKEYKFKLRFWVNSLCEEIITIRGEGVPLLLDLYEGCQKSYDLGIVKVGQKVIKEIQVMNHSQISIDATFIFREMYGVTEDDGAKSEATSLCLNPDERPSKTKETRGKMLQSYRDDKVKEQLALDVKNALASLKVTPDNAVIEPHRKVPLKIRFKPIGLISALDVQLNIKVLSFERPLVRLRGSASGMYLYLSQNSLQFGRVRKHGCKLLKVMLLNKGDFDTRFCWQPLNRQEFSIAPMQGIIEAHSNVTFTVSFRPQQENPFIKGWASCNIENYNSLEIAMYGTCVNIGDVQNLSLYFECPVRQIQTNYVPVTNPTDDLWLIESELTGLPFETLKRFTIEPNSTFQIPITYRPKTIGRDEGQVIYSPLKETALILTLIGSSTHPLPNDTINVVVAAKESKTIELKVFNLTEFPESYTAIMEIIKILPDKFENYEFKYPQMVKVWGEAAATFKLTFACYEECEMQVKMMFINDTTREYQYYMLNIKVTPSPIADIITMASKARETVIHTLTLRNPLSQEAEFLLHSDTLNYPKVKRIPPCSEAKISLEYSPLVVGTTEELLVISNPIVGSLFYKMILKCLPAKEKNMEYTTPLGNIIPIRLRVENRSDYKTDFLCTISHASIQCERLYQLNGHEKGKFLVWFEPTELGTQQCVVTFSSSIAGDFVLVNLYIYNNSSGNVMNIIIVKAPELLTIMRLYCTPEVPKLWVPEYSFNITGTASFPKPQGPIDIKAGGSNYVKFKNVFDDTKTFTFYTDREEFYIRTPFEVVKSKKDCLIMVSLSDLPQEARLPTGVMTVELQDSMPKIVWTYFLRGIP